MKPQRTIKNKSCKTGLVATKWSHQVRNSNQFRISAQDKSNNQEFVSNFFQTIRLYPQLPSKLSCWKPKRKMIKQHRKSSSRTKIVIFRSLSILDLRILSRTKNMKSAVFWTNFPTRSNLNNSKVQFHTLVK